MRLEGFEPSRPFGHQPLKLARLPFRHKRLVAAVGFEPTRDYSRQDLNLVRLPFRHAAVWWGDQRNWIGRMELAENHYPTDLYSISTRTGTQEPHFLATPRSRRASRKSLESVDSLQSSNSRSVVAWQPQTMRSIFTPIEWSSARWACSDASFYF